MRGLVLTAAYPAGRLFVIVVGGWLLRKAGR